MIGFGGFFELQTEAIMPQRGTATDLPFLLITQDKSARLETAEVFYASEQDAPRAANARAIILGKAKCRVLRIELTKGGLEFRRL